MKRRLRLLPPTNHRESVDPAVGAAGLAERLELTGAQSHQLADAREQTLELLDADACDRRESEAAVVYSITSGTAQRAAENEPATPSGPEVLTVPELADLLRLKAKSVYALLSRDPDAIPGCRKVGGAWRAHRATVLAWLAGQNRDARQRQRGVR